MNARLPISYLICLGVTGTLLSAAGPARETAGTAQENGAAGRFTAFAVSLGSPGPATAGVVEIVIKRWSTDSERDRLLTVLLEQGPDKLLDALQDMPSVGYIRTPNSLGYDLRFARRNELEDGGEQINIATDRYISFWEARNRPRTIDYPFTVIEMRLKGDGEGEGKMSLATRITANKRKGTIELENYQSQPVLLTQVKRES